MNETFNGDSVFSPFQHITSLLLDLVGQGDHLGQGLPLHLGQVAIQPYQAGLDPWNKQVLSKWNLKDTLPD